MTDKPPRKSNKHFKTVDARVSISTDGKTMFVRIPTQKRPIFPPASPQK